MISRHPRFTLGIGFLILCAFLLLANQDSIPQGSNAVVRYSSYTDAMALKNRLKDSEAAYKRVLKQRQGLIHKFGPTPDKIEMFPPSAPPYPPYTLWDYFPAAFNCPHEIERLGALGDGGKWVCGISRLVSKPDCVVYSVGINYESSFEAEILGRTSGCQIWGYDFSVKSFGPEIPATQNHRTHFFPYGLGGDDAHGPEDEHKFWTLPSLMAKNGHTFIDILKIDIEGWEFDTLATLLKTYRDKGEPFPFGQLQLEIHAWKRKFPEFLKWWEALEEMGLRPFWTEPNLVYQNYNRGASAELAEYSFINIHGHHDLIEEASSKTSSDHPHRPPAKD